MLLTTKRKCWYLPKCDVCPPTCFLPSQESTISTDQSPLSVAHLVDTASSARRIRLEESHWQKSSNTKPALPYHGEKTAATAMSRYIELLIHSFETHPVLTFAATGLSYIVIFSTVMTLMIRWVLADTLTDIFSSAQSDRCLLCGRSGTVKAEGDESQLQPRKKKMSATK